MSNRWIILDFVSYTIIAVWKAHSYSIDWLQARNRARSKKLKSWDFGYCGHYWPTVPAPDDKWGWLWRNWWNEDWQGKPKYSEKTCPSDTLSTTNPTWLDPGSNPGRRGGKPATNRLSYGADMGTKEDPYQCPRLRLKQRLLLTVTQQQDVI
jgi:hypothetical protein